MVREGGNCEANIGKEVGEGDENGTQIKQRQTGMTDISRKVGEDGRVTRTDADKDWDFEVEH